MIQKKRIITSLDKLPQEALEALKEKYPYGYADYVMKIDKGNNNSFYAVPLETEEISYLIKVNVEIDDVEELNAMLFDDDDDDNDSGTGGGGENDIIANSDNIEFEEESDSFDED